MTKKLLPMGWHEADAVGLPGDAGTPPEEWEDTANPQHPRQEVKRWTRGNQRVRVCRCDKHEDHPYQVRYGNYSREDGHYTTVATLAQAEAKALFLMGMGGKP